MENERMLWETYELRGQVGAGGLSTIFLAYHRRLQKNVVLKKTKAKYMKTIDVRAEADILKNLHHMYLPQVLDFVEYIDDAGEHVIYTIMDYIEGEDFDTLLKKQSFSHAQVLKYMYQLCEVVNYLHSHNPAIIHGDIKPANIILTPNDTICLIDFNISGYTDTIEIKGYSKCYASPEQYQKFVENSQMLLQMRKVNVSNPSDEETVPFSETQSKTEFLSELEESGVSQVTDSSESTLPVVQVDKRTDIYSIGAVMYRLLINKELEDDYTKIVPLSQMPITISDSFAYIIDRAMEPNPKERFQSVDEMLKAMQHIAKKDRRYRRMLRKQIAGCVVLVFLAAGCVVSSYVGYRQIRQEKASSFYQTAQQLYENRQYDDDLGFILKEALKDESIYDTAMLGNMYYLAGECSFQAEQYQAAAEFFEKVLNYNKDSQEVYCNYAISLVRIKQYDRAVQIIDEAIAQGIQEDQICLMKGELAVAFGKEEEAIENFKTCISITTDSYVLARAYIMYSDAYSNQQNYENDVFSVVENIKLLQEAQTKVSAEYQPLILERLADAYTVCGDIKQGSSKEYYQMAIQTLQKEMDCGWDNYDVDMNLAALYDKCEEYDKSYEIYRAILKKYGENYNIYKRLAFLEMNVQYSLAEDKRDYSEFVEDYKKSRGLFEDTGKRLDEDMEMVLLENAYQTLQETNWIKE